MIDVVLEGRPWQDLIPDQDHSVVTKGYGTFGKDDRTAGGDYVTAARTGDGRLVMAYVPSTGTEPRTITVDMARLSGPAVARWYNPTDGTYRSLVGSPLANRDARDFATPGDNGTGTNDWVLVLESAPLPLRGGDSEDSSAGKSDPAAAAELVTTVGRSSWAQSFREILRTCLDAPNCELMTIFGVTDKWHWLVLAGHAEAPVIFDGNFDSKPAYAAILEELQTRRRKARWAPPRTPSLRESPKSCIPSSCSY